MEANFVYFLIKQKKSLCLRIYIYPSLKFGINTYRLELPLMLSYRVYRSLSYYIVSKVSKQPLKIIYSLTT